MESLRRHLAAAVLALAAFVAAPASAQTGIWTATIDAVPELGDVVVAETGPTDFTFTPYGIVGQTGSGVRRGTGLVRGTVTITCERDQTGSDCNKGKTGKVRIGAIGSPTGKARQLKDFTVISGGAISGVTSTNDWVNFTVELQSKDTPVVLNFGATYRIRGGNQAGAYGAANASFYVYAAKTGTPTTGPTGVATATALRGISLTGSPTLQFGGIVKPSIGSSVVTLNPSNNERTISGTGFGTPSPAHARASYTVTGETGMALTVTVPGTLTMNRALGGGSILVNLTSDSVPTNLGQAMGSEGTDDFYVGGNFTIDTSTLTGVYSGSFNVTVAYN